MQSYEFSNRPSDMGWKRSVTRFSRKSSPQRNLPLTKARFLEGQSQSFACVCARTTVKPAFHALLDDLKEDGRQYVLRQVWSDMTLKPQKSTPAYAFGVPLQ